MKMTSEREQEKGFALIEVVIALAIVAIIASGFLMALSTSSKAIFVANERTTAESLARSQMEYVKSQIYDDTNNPPSYSLLSDIPGGYGVEITAEYFDADGDGIIEVDVTTTEVREDDEGIQKITVTVNHLSKPDVITLEGYKTDR